MAAADAIADDQLSEWLAAVRTDPGPPLADQDLTALRAAAVARARSRPRGPEMHAVEDLKTRSGLRLRRYRPRPVSDTVVLYLHGGGFVFGDLDTSDTLCRRLAAAADVTVLSVDYRRAPEHPAPAAIDDAIEAYHWLLQHDESAPGLRIALAGDSAGGAVALLAATALREQRSRLDGLLLLYPNADMTLSRPSITAKGTGWGLEASDLAWLIAQWIPAASDRQDPRFDPLHAHLNDLPATIVVTAEHDPLRDEGAELAQRLHTAGVDTTHLDEPGLVHGFLGLAHLSPAAEQASNRAFTVLGKALAQGHR